MPGNRAPGTLQSPAAICAGGGGYAPPHPLHTHLPDNVHFCSAKPPANGRPMVRPGAQPVVCRGNGIEDTCVTHRTCIPLGVHSAVLLPQNLWGCDTSAHPISFCRPPAPSASSSLASPEEGTKSQLREQPAKLEREPHRARTLGHLPLIPPHWDGGVPVAPSPTAHRSLLRESLQAPSGKLFMAVHTHTLAHCRGPARQCRPIPPLHLHSLYRAALANPNVRWRIIINTTATERTSNGAQARQTASTGMAFQRTPTPNFDHAAVAHHVPL